MNYLDLFHGIGGFALGAYWAGMKFDKHFCSDIEPWCRKLYELRFPDSVQLGDIRDIDFKELGKKNSGDWIITGGFPCQDISIAGKGAGIEGKRSGLWFEYWRAIRELRPRFAIIENVGAITFRGLDSVLSSLAEIWYDAEWQDIRAEDMGAPHKREREWIVAYPNKQRLQKPTQRKLRSFQEKIKTSKGCNPGRRIAKKGSAWEIEPEVGRLANGIPGRVDQLKGLGNSIVPQISELLFNLIKPYCGGGSFNGNR